MFVCHCQKSQSLQRKCSLRKLRAKYLQISWKLTHNLLGEEGSVSDLCWSFSQTSRKLNGKGWYYISSATFLAFFSSGTMQYELTLTKVRNLLWTKEKSSIFLWTILVCLGCHNKIPQTGWHCLSLFSPSSRG